MEEIKLISAKKLKIENERLKKFIKKQKLIIDNQAEFIDHLEDKEDRDKLRLIAFHGDGMGLVQ